MVVDQLPRLGKRELICLLLFTCNYVVSVWRGFLFLWMLGMGYLILLWQSLSLPYNYFEKVGLYWICHVLPWFRGTEIPGYCTVNPIVLSLFINNLRTNCENFDHIMHGHLY